MVSASVSPKCPPGLLPLCTDVDCGPQNGGRGVLGHVGFIMESVCSVVGQVGFFMGSYVGRGVGPRWVVLGRVGMGWFVWVSLVGSH